MGDPSKFGQQLDAAAPAPAPGQAPTGDEPKPPTMTRRELAVLGVMVAGGVLVITLAVLSRGLPSTQAAVATSSVAAPTAVRTTAVTPAWSDVNRDLWLERRGKGVAYDVDAENTVAIWMRSVRPMLVVRCARGETEVFVVTHSAAQIQTGTEDHTVTFRFDNGPGTTELWPDSTAHDALFAPDGEAFARRLLAARTLQFGFTPHNAQPAVARFAVAGLEPLLSRAAKDCGWTK